MKRMAFASVVMISAALCGCFRCSAAVPLRWTVETSRLQPAVFDAVRGESLDLEASFQSYGTPLAMAGKDVRIFYQTNGMGSAWWTGAATATSNRIAATFTPAMDPGGSVVHGFLGSTGDIYRAAFTLRFRNGPGAVPNVITQPPRVLDLGATTVINPPWPTDATIATRIRTVIDEDGITSGLNTNDIVSIVTRTNDVGFTEWNEYYDPINEWIIHVYWNYDEWWAEFNGQGGGYFPTGDNDINSTYISFSGYEFHRRKLNGENALGLARLVDIPTDISMLKDEYGIQLVNSGGDVSPEHRWGYKFGGSDSFRAFAYLDEVGSAVSSLTNNGFVTASVVSNSLKTINGNVIYGTGNIDISGIGGTSSQNALTTNASGIVESGLGIKANPGDVLLKLINSYGNTDIEISQSVSGGNASTLTMHAEGTPASPTIILEDSGDNSTLHTAPEILIGDVHVRGSITNLTTKMGKLYDDILPDLSADVLQSFQSATMARSKAETAITNCTQLSGRLTDIEGSISGVSSTASSAYVTANSASIGVSMLAGQVDEVSGSISGGIKNPYSLTLNPPSGSPVVYDGSEAKQIDIPNQYTDESAISAVSLAGFVKADVTNAVASELSGKADAETVTQLGTQVAAIGSLLNGDDAHFVSTNYDSVVRLPEAYVEIKQNGNWLTIWKEMTRWNRFVGDGFDWSTNSWSGFQAWRTSISSELSFKAERNWGMYDSETGGLSPEGYTQISSSNLLIAANMAYQRTVTSGGSVWVLQCNSGTATFGGETNGYFRVSDGDGNVQFEIVRGDRREMGADASGITVNNSANPATVIIPYSVDADEHPTLRICDNLSTANWKDETDADCIANVTWSGSSGAWSALVQRKTAGTSLFVKATYMAGGETYIRNAAPVSMTSIYLNGTKYYLGTATISGHTVLTLSTTAPAN